MTTVIELRVILSKAPTPFLCLYFLGLNFFLFKNFSSLVFPIIRLHLLIVFEYLKYYDICGPLSMVSWLIYCLCVINFLSVSYSLYISVYAITFFLSWPSCMLLFSCCWPQGCVLVPSFCTSQSLEGPLDSSVTLLQGMQALLSSLLCSHLLLSQYRQSFWDSMTSRPPPSS